MKKFILPAVALLALGLVAYGAYTVYQIRNPQTLFKKSVASSNMQKNSGNESDQQNTLSPDSISTEQSNSQTTDETTGAFKGDRVNILLLGFDEAPERQKMGIFRTDTIILASIDFKNSEVYILSIPRDSYVEIPGFEGRFKINEAFNKGGGIDGKGFEKAMETVSNFIGGIPVNYYMSVDMTVFKEVIDLIGGIEYDVDVPVVMNGRELKAGPQVLTGQQVLDYSRNRNTKLGDIDRVDRQQRILLAAFKQLKEKAQLTQIPEIYLKVKDKINTNMNLKQISSLALFGSNIDLDQIHRYTVKGGFLLKDGVYYWGIKQNEKQKTVEEIFGVKIEVNPEDDIDYIRKQEEEKNAQQ